MKSGQRRTSKWTCLQALQLQPHAERVKQMAANNVQTRNRAGEGSQLLNLGRWWISLFIKLKEKEMLEVKATVSMFSRPPSCAQTPFEIPLTMVCQIHSPEAMPNSLLEKAPGWVSPERQPSPPCHYSVCTVFTNSNSAQDCPSPQTERRIWPCGGFCFCFCCLSALNFQLVFRQRVHDF